MAAGGVRRRGRAARCLAGRRHAAARRRSPRSTSTSRWSAGLLQRGIFAAVELRDPADRVVLPHEDVMPGPVADRLELMRATGANLEPILLVYEGGGATAAVIAVVATDAAADRDDDRRRARAAGLARSTDPALHERISEDLGTAAGTDRRRPPPLCHLPPAAGGEARRPASRPAPGTAASRCWSTRRPIRCGCQAIHRVVEGLPLADALDRGRRRVQRLARWMATSTPRCGGCTRRRARTRSCSPMGLPSGCSASPT